MRPYSSFIEESDESESEEVDVAEVTVDVVVSVEAAVEEVDGDSAAVELLAKDRITGPFFR